MDWSEIKALSQFEAETLVKDYCNNKGFIALKIKETSVPEGQKTPDLEVKLENKLNCYIEVKSPEHNLNPDTKMYHWNTSYNKLRRFTRTASKQFKDYDTNHTVPWILAVTSNHPQFNWTHFTNRISNAVVFNGQIIRDFNPTGQARQVDTDVMELDLVIWFQINYIDRKSIAELKFFINKDSQFVKQVEDIATKLKV